MRFVTENIGLSLIDEMEIRAKKVPGSISLAQGVPSFSTPKSIWEKAIKSIEKGLTDRYTLAQGIAELRIMAAEALKKEGMIYDAETEIIATAGSTEGITATLLAIVESGNEVIIFSPSYTSYQDMIKLSGGVPVFVNLDEENGWDMNIAALEKAITPKTKAVLFANPNNPTGSVFSKENLMKLADLAEKHDFFILSDEVYKDFVFDGGRAFSLAEIPELRKRVIRLFSFSKTYAMTGWRIGFLHSDKETAHEILKSHDAIMNSPSAVSQYAALAAMEMSDEEIKKIADEFQARRDLICRRLDRLDKIFSYQKPTGSYFIFPKILTESKDSWQFCLDLLEKAKVVLVPGAAFGPSGEGHVRMCFGRSDEDVNEAFDRLEKYFM